MIHDDLPRLDLAQWPRRPQYAFYRGYAQPFFGLTAEVDTAPLHAACRATGASFSLACWYAVGRAVNGVEALRYRLRPDGVAVHPRVRVATTAPTGPETFAFVYLPAADDFPSFERGARAAIAAAVSRVGQPMDHRPDDDGVFHGTVLPWVRFTAIKHAWPADAGTGIPRIAMGRAVWEGERRPMPLAIEVHHALADGVHVGRFYQAVEGLLADPRWLGGAAS